MSDWKAVPIELTEAACANAGHDMRGATTKGYAIKLPDGSIVHVEPDENEEYTWSEFMLRSRDKRTRKEWGMLGLSCVPVTITEGELKEAKREPS